MAKKKDLKARIAELESSNERQAAEIIYLRNQLERSKPKPFPGPGITPYDRWPYAPFMNRTQ